jgi:hypothetical protein
LSNKGSVAVNITGISIIGTSAGAFGYVGLGGKTGEEGVGFSQ